MCSNKDSVQPKFKNNNNDDDDFLNLIFCICFLPEFNCLSAFSWSSLSFLHVCLISSYIIYFITSSEQPCELPWKKPWASSHPQAQPRTMKSASVSGGWSPRNHPESSTKKLGGSSSEPGQHSQVLY